MRVLLDENFPLRLARRLREAGHAAEHIIERGQRGLPDSAIRVRLGREADLVLLTQDLEFGEQRSKCRGRIVVSRLRQSLPLEQRVAIWITTLEQLLHEPTEEGAVFEILETGTLVPWRGR